MTQLKTLTIIAIAGLLGACSRPVAQFTHAGGQKAPSLVQFTNQSEKAETYEWDFGDGNKSTEASPTHRYLSSGNYTVKLKAMKDKKARIKEHRLLIEPPSKCLVDIETEFGHMLVELYDATPKHQENFIKLVDQGFFDSLMFHRVIEGFMIQGGDPDSKRAKPGQQLGSGGPGFTIPAEFVDTLVHTKGSLAAARQGDQVNPQKRSSGSQFYIVQGRPLTAPQLDLLEAQKNIRYSTAQREIYLKSGGTPFLDKEYTVFGRIIEGLDVLDQIAATKVDSFDRPKKDVRMKMKVIR
ncbi:MAG: peptidylprolyl isomerase [Saprospiraceae bacterium]|jgi:peptidyl-prolyl cis-trans isomerase B (cyclophilin B)|nr:peptidylprolyl isomerase [Saprospiraceae bacterium]